MQQTPITIVTFNTSGLPSPRHAHARVKMLAKLLSEIDISILNLQELHTYSLLHDLRSSLKTFKYISYKPGLLGPKAGLVTLSKLPITESQFHGTAFHKGVLVSKFANQIIGLNVHLPANTDGDWTRANRFYPAQQAQLEALKEICANYNQAHTLILTGDLNLARTSDLLGPFKKKGHWRDAFQDNAEPTFHEEFLPKERKPQCIDYILWQGETLELVDSDRRFTDRVAIKGRYSHLSNHIALSANFLYTR